jgi:hypothetical protein
LFSKPSAVGDGTIKEDTNFRCLAVLQDPKEEGNGFSRLRDDAIAATQLRKIAQATIPSTEENSTTESGFQGNDEVETVDPELFALDLRQRDATFAPGGSLLVRAGAAADRDALPLDQVVAVADQGKARVKGIGFGPKPGEIGDSFAKNGNLVGIKEMDILRAWSPVSSLVC